MSLTVENFLQILKDDRIKKELNDIFEPAIVLTITEKFKSFETNMQRTINGLQATIHVLRDELKLKDDAITALKTDNVALRKEVIDLTSANNDLEQFCRKDNLVITGLPASYGEAASSANTDDSESSTETMQKVQKLFHDELHLDIEDFELSTAHRLPAKSGHHPILIRFTRRCTRDLIFRNRFILKGYNKGKDIKNRVFINEDLSPFNRSLFAAAWRLKGDGKPFESVWTSNCHIFVKKDGQRLRVTTFDQLQSLR